VADLEKAARTIIESYDIRAEEQPDDLKPFINDMTYSCYDALDSCSDCGHVNKNFRGEELA
jgi:hypothetical protein